MKTSTELPALEYWKTKFLKKEKMANPKLGNLVNLRNITLSFLILEFLILAIVSNQKRGFKNLGKKFPRFPRFPRFLSFWLGHLPPHFYVKYKRLPAPLTSTSTRTTFQPAVALSNNDVRSDDTSTIALLSDDSK